MVCAAGVFDLTMEERGLRYLGWAEREFEWRKSSPSADNYFGANFNDNKDEKPSDNALKTTTLYKVCRTRLEAILYFSRD